MGRTTWNRDGPNAQPTESRGTSQPTDPNLGASRSDNPDATDKLDAILAAIAKFDTKIDTVALDLNLLRADQKKTLERVKRVEMEVAALYPLTTELQTQETELSKRVGFLEYRAEDS